MYSSQSIIMYVKPVKSERVTVPATQLHISPLFFNNLFDLLL